MVKNISIAIFSGTTAFTGIAAFTMPLLVLQGYLTELVKGDG